MDSLLVLFVIKIPRIDRGELQTVLKGQRSVFNIEVSDYKQLGKIYRVCRQKCRYF